MTSEPTARGVAGDSPEPTRVALIAPDSLYRNAIESVLREQVWVEWVGVVAPEGGAARLLAGTEPEIVIVGEAARLPALCDASPDARLILMETPESLAAAAQLPGRRERRNPQCSPVTETGQLHKRREGCGTQLQCSWS